MTIKDCYKMMHGDYEEARGRLFTDALVERFVLKFLDDLSMKNLRDAVERGDISESFQAAHALKGVTANLAFTELAKAASELTEQLRPQTAVADPELYAKVEAAYQCVEDAIFAYKADSEG